jgi:hypothetical protein
MRDWKDVSGQAESDGEEPELDEVGETAGMAVFAVETGRVRVEVIVQSVNRELGCVWLICVEGVKEV